MKMHQSKIKVLHEDGCSDSNDSEILLSALLSEWLFSSKFWSNFNLKNETMFDQYEEDEASISVVASIAEALEKSISMLKLEDVEFVDFVYGWMADGETPYTARISKSQLLKELKALQIFLKNAVRDSSPLCLSL